MAEAADLGIGAIRAASSVADLAAVLRQLRRREARERGDSPYTYRELAAKTGWAHGVIGDYFSGRTLPPTDRFDVLVGLLGASQEELGALATARDRVEERRRRPAPAVSVPRELPRPVSGFVGRDRELAWLDDAEGTVVVSGSGGVGKTALAVQWASRVAARFPDGCLYVDLRGYGPDEPVTPADALTGFLRGLGVAGADLPVGTGELAARYRTLLAGRRTLIVLDNARTAEQVRPLLPGALSCLVLVTSRDQLPGLVARDGARRVDLDRLPPADAAALLRTLVGRRADADPAATEALAARCAHLPLALRVAAELAAARPSAGLAELVAELDAGSPLDLLDAGGDQDTAVRAVFGCSYRNLSPEAARTFALLGLCPGTELDAASVAALAGTDRVALAELVRAHLVDVDGGGRYGMHDLLRAYAAELAGTDADALDRLHSHLLAVAGQAPAEVLDAELANLVALSGQATRDGGSAFPVRLSATLWRYLDRGSRYAEALVVHGNAVTAARALGEVDQEAAALGELGQIHARLGRYAEALAHLRGALESGTDPAREATSSNRLAIVYSRLGRSAEAIEHYQRALAIHRETGDLAGAGRVLGNLGAEYADRGQYPQAVEHFEQALQVALDLGDRYGEGNARNNLGLALSMLGRHEDALAQYQLGLPITRAIGDRAGEGRLLANLGVAHTLLGNHRQAREQLDRALRIHRAMGDRAAEAEALCYLGDLHLAVGAPAGALTGYQQALAIAREIGFRLQAARAMEGLGDSAPDPALAREHWTLALAEYTELGVPDAQRLRARLAGHQSEARWQ